jgi:Domain of unknown function (DUF1735)
MNKKFINFMGMLAVVAGMTSCLKDKGFDDQDYGVDISGTPSVSNRSVKILEGGTSSGDIKKLVFADGSAALDSLEFSVAYVDYTTPTSQLASADVTVTFGTDPAYVAAYNATSTVQYELMPDSLFILSKTSVVIKKGTFVSELVKVYFKPNKFDGSKTYLLPIVLKTATGISGIQIQQNFGRISYTKIGNVLSGKYSHRFRRFQVADTTGVPLQNIFSTVIIPPVSPSEVMTTEPYTTTFIDASGGIVLGFTNTGGVLSNFTQSLTAATYAGITSGVFILNDGPKLTAGGQVIVVGNAASNYIGTRFSTYIQYINSSGGTRTLINDFVKIP